ncbi:MAG: SDR family NAD(P)-dependent oxidoreductase [Microcystis sp. M20BS1]|uniref:SDR family NAD(P)-dependent oxidoreductase n=1 Tax=unclassified Microcystis TaxID=2643300 RepID=UPI00257BAC71|nr:MULTISPECIES: SDR family NAD(P)-dependent oxidoreductase [unclassified Microcystis]MCA2624610.1 SDR family NAD(P)-dependent oxidoreductase [Microcystis sp. M19BS1]MCA2631910.1 SDR family NAD(P)-dependent oxidoreductase [Microcystis sp. M20BS1]
MTYSSDSKQAVGNQEIVKLLSHYFSNRSQFLSQVIKADLQSYILLKSPATNLIPFQSSVQVNSTVNSNGHSTVNSNGHSTVNSNGHSTVNSNGHSTVNSNGHSNGNSKRIPETTVIQTNLTVEKRLIELVAEKTGYPVASINLDAKLLDDLNLDSIKAGELVATAAKTFGVSGKIDPSALANATLQEVKQAIDAVVSVEMLTEVPEQIEVAPLVLPPSDSLDITQKLLELVEEKTGFPKDTLSLDLRLLDDLNLDSIKAAELVATAVKQVGATGKLDPSALANGTLADVIAALEKVSNQPSVKTAASEKTPVLQGSQNNPPPESNWVRNYAIEYVPQPLTPPTIATDWSQAQVLIVSDAATSIAKILTKQLEQLGAQVQQKTYAEIAAAEPASIGSFSHYLGILPGVSPLPSELPLAAMVTRLSSVATISHANPSATLAYVQFGGGRFGTSEGEYHPAVVSAAAFARSVHLERQEARVRVIDLAAAIEPTQAGKLVIQELAGDEGITTVGYDARQVRLIPQAQLQQPIDYTPRSLTWSASDVILVTGGAKGITAECALALGQETGVKMALVGRAAVPAAGDSNSEIAQTLKRLAAQGLTGAYYRCNIADPTEVQQLVDQVTQELGPITGVIHGAGLNQPRRVEQVRPQDAQTEVSPKLLGAYNLLQALASNPPKLFIAFSSIIGVTGMPGNAWYAFANESLSLLLQQYQRQHPQTQVLALAYSVWDEIGMGARLGSVKHLERMGIKAISPREGVSRFLQLFQTAPSTSQVVITARLGGLDTWLPTPLPAPTGLRFIENVQYVEPQVALTVRTHLSLEKDLYVKDHLWRGSYLFPTVFGLCAMAQAVAYLTGTSNPPIVRLEDISLRRPIVVNPETGVEIQIEAEIAEATSNGERRVKVGIYTEQTGFSLAHFSANLILGELTSAFQEKPELGQPLPIAPKTDLYGDLLFQGERFQRLGEIYTLSEKQSVFRSHAQLSGEDLSNQSFSKGLNQSLILGDPYFRDVLLQSVQLTIPQDICLPVEIAKIERFKPASSDQGRRLVTVNLLAREDREYISEVIATDEQGNLIERLSGYRLRILEEHPENPTAAELVNPEIRDRQHLRQVLQTTCQGLEIPPPTVALGYAPNLQGKSLEQRRQQEKPIVERALKTKLGLKPEQKLVFELESLPSGKPQLSGTQVSGLNVSLSHCDRYCLCTVAETPQGCDIEAITPRSTEDWVALLSDRRSQLMEQLVRQGDTQERAGMRIWSATEAVRKAFNGSDPQFCLVAKQGDGVLLSTSTPEGESQVLTVPVKLTRPPERMVAMVVSHTPVSVPTEANFQSPQATEAAIIPATPGKIDSHSSRYTHDGPQGQLVYEQRYQVSFKDSGSISRHVYFAQYFRWIGKIRELPMESIAQQMLADFLTGDWGMVTNSVSLRVVGEATSYDVIQARAWVGNIVGSSFETYIEFCKVLPDNSLERLAIAEVKATWVRLVSYGVPAPMPFPPYLQDYLARFAADKPASLDLKHPETLPLAPLPASLASLKPGAVIDDIPQQESRYGRLLRSEVFQTTLEESNLVGNVYYGNYFIWQGRILDLFLYSVAPEYLRISNPCGEMVCLYTRMDYLREAMPFDRIRTLLYVRSVSECGASFNFEFFREQPDGTLEKLHVGQQDVAWVERRKDGTAVAAPWPEAVKQSLVARATTREAALLMV